MAEATLTDVIERLKAEGQLTRNTGTNSIKSVKIVLSSAIDDQTEILQSMLNVMTSQAQLQEKKDKLGKAGKDVGEKKQKKTDEQTAGLLSRIFAPAKEEGLKFGGIILAPIIAPLRSLLRILRVGGPVAIVVGLLWSVFKDIGENESFVNALENIKRDWNESILPTFERIRNSFNNLIESETISGIMDNLERDIESLQKFVVNIINNIMNTIEGVIEGINLLLDGEFVEGIEKIVKSVISGLLGAIDSLATTVLELFGVDFGEDGTIGGLIKRTMSEFRESVEEKWNNLVSFFHETIPNAFSNVLVWARGKFEGILESIQDKWTSLVGEDGIIGIIWSPIDSAITWIKTLFTDPVEALKQLWETHVGSVNNIADLLFMPINAAVNWLSGKLGWSDEDAPEFSIRSILDKWVEDITEWIRSIFSFLPSLDSIRERINGMIPSWLRSSSDDPEAEARAELRRLETERRELIRQAEMNMMSTGIMEPIDTSFVDRKIEELREQIGQYRYGTKGFMDFGAGTPAMLHGIEAVVPRNTAAGEFLANNFTENWEPIMQRISGIESSALQQSTAAPIIITNAPTVAPVNNNIRGATNVSNQRISGVGMADASGLGRFAN